MSKSTFFYNRTYRYLSPLIRILDPKLPNILNTLEIQNFKIEDPGLGCTEKYLYISIHANPINLIGVNLDKYCRVLQQTLQYIRTKEYYVTDTLYTIKPLIHTIKICFPLRYSAYFTAFENSLYSTMFKEKEIEKLFTVSDKHKLYFYKEETKMILRRDPDYLPYFVAQVNKDFEDNISVSSFTDCELDYNINKKEEYFDYETTNTTSY